MLESSVDAQQVTSIAKDAAIGVAALIAAFVGIGGLSTWRRQLHGQTQFDVARQFVRASYKVRDAFVLVRRRSAFSSENAELEGADAKSPSGKWDESKAYGRRWRILERAMGDLETESLEAEVVWGEESINLMMVPIRKAVNELKYRLFEFAESSRRTHTQQDRELAVKLRHKFLGDFDGKEDDLACDMGNAMDAVDKWKRKYMRS